MKTDSIRSRWGRRALSLVSAIPVMFLIAAHAKAQQYRWSDFAGAPGGIGNADGMSNVAHLYYPYGVAVDGSGNVYFSDYDSQTIRKVTPGGVVTTLAGSPGVTGMADGTGSAAQFCWPGGLAVDGSGNVYVADTFNETIRKVTPSGVVTTLAGSPGVTGTADGAGSAAQFSWPNGVCVDGSGNVYVADSDNCTIRMVTPAGVVTTLAGNPATSGTADGTGSAALFNEPAGVAVDGSGNVYVADTQNDTIRMVTQAGVVTTLAGMPEVSGTADGTGGAAQFSWPWELALDPSGNIYVADTLNQTVRMVTQGGVVTTLAGTPGVTGTANGTGGGAQFFQPFGVATDGSGNAYVADTDNNAIRLVTPGGVVTTLAGGPFVTGTTDAPRNAARFCYPYGVAVDGSGNVYVADTDNCTIRMAAPGGVVTTLAGSPGVSGTNDGTGSGAMFAWPAGVAVDGSGNVYVADTDNSTVRKIAPGGVVTTLAGSAGVTGSADGTGSGALFDLPEGVAVDGSGNVYVADTKNDTIRMVTPGGVVTTLAGSPGVSGTNDGTGSDALFNSPGGIAVDGNGNVYVADTDNCTIRLVTAGGVVTTLAGCPGVTGTVDGAGNTAWFGGRVYDGYGNVYYGGIGGLAVDGSGNLYVADTGNDTIRMVTPGGVVTTIGGSPGVVGGSDGLGPAALFSSPQSVAVSSSGTLYVADGENNRIEMGVLATFGTAFSSNVNLAFTPGKASVVIPVLDNDVPASGGNLTITSFTQGSMGRVTINPNGTLTYTPFKIYPGVDSFTYTVTDGLGDTATETVMVGNGFVTAAGSYAGLITNGTAASSLAIITPLTTTPVTTTPVTTTPVTTTPVTTTPVTTTPAANGTVSNDSSGYFTARLTNTGKFSGKLYVGGIGYPVKGTFGTNWDSSLTIKRTDQGNLTAQLQLDPANRQITGTVTDGTFTSAFTAGRLSYSAKYSPAPQAGEFTVLLPPDPSTSGSAAYPQGNGYLTLKISTGGTVKAVGKLGDGTPLSGGGLLVTGSSFPFYAGLYGNKYPERGSVFGNITVSGTGAPGDTCSAALTWFKPKQTKGNYYQAGFATASQAIGSRYITPKKGVCALALRGSGEVALENGNLSALIDRTITLSTANKVTVDAPAGDTVKLELRITPATGAFCGSFDNVAGSKPDKCSFSGVLLQNQVMGGGLFMGPTQSGAVELGPAP